MQTLLWDCADAQMIRTSALTLTLLVSSHAFDVDAQSLSPSRADYDDGY